MKIEKKDYSKPPSTKSKEGALENLTLFEFPIRKDAAAFLTFSTNWVVENCAAEKVQVFVHFKTEQTNWENWQLLEPGFHAKTDADRRASTLIFSEKIITYWKSKR